MKPQSIFTACLILMVIAGSHAQNTPSDSLWKTSVKFGVNVNQASFSSNWKAGGVNSIGLNSQFNLKANYSKGRSTWDNEIDLLYGFVSNSGQGFRKTVDKIYLDTKYGNKLSEHWSLFSSLNFLSQFAPGYEYTVDANGAEQANLISDAFAPAFVTFGIGVEYHPVEYFKARFAPFAPRLTIVKDPERFVTTARPEPYGVKPPDQTRFEVLGFQLLAEFNKEIATNLNLQWRYVMFGNYETLQLKTLDHRLDINFIAKVNRFINVGLGGILIYDYDQDSEVQLSQAFTLGFLYTFRNYPEEKK